MARVTDSSKRHGTMVYDDTCVDFLYLYLDFIYICVCVCVCVARGDAPLSGALVHMCIPSGKTFHLMP
jgi:hypothetical protein